MRLLCACPLFRTRFRSVEKMQCIRQALGTAVSARRKKEKKKNIEARLLREKRRKGPVPICAPLAHPKKKGSGMERGKRLLHKKRM